MGRTIQLAPAPAMLRAVFHAAEGEPYSLPVVGVAVVTNGPNVTMEPVVATPDGLELATDLADYVGPWMAEESHDDPLPMAVASRMLPIPLKDQT